MKAKKQGEQFLDLALELAFEKLTEGNERDRDNARLRIVNEAGSPLVSRLMDAARSLEIELERCKSGNTYTLDPDERLAPLLAKVAQMGERLLEFSRMAYAAWEADRAAARAEEEAEA